MTDKEDKIIELLETIIKKLDEQSNVRHFKDAPEKSKTSVEQFMDNEISSGNIYIEHQKTSSKRTYTKTGDLHKEYFEFCRTNNLKPIGVRQFEKLVVGMYSPDPENISVIYSGYNRFEFLKSKEHMRIKYAHATVEEFINSLLESGDLEINTESDHNPVAEKLYREYIKYSLDNYPDLETTTEPMFKLVLKDQFAPSKDFVSIGYHIDFFHDCRVEKTEVDYKEKKQRVRRRLPNAPVEEGDK